MIANHLVNDNLNIPTSFAVAGNTGCCGVYRDTFEGSESTPRFLSLAGKVETCCASRLYKGSGPPWVSSNSR
jgi:hypothetical protein